MAKKKLLPINLKRKFRVINITEFVSNQIDYIIEDRINAIDYCIAIETYCTTDTEFNAFIYYLTIAEFDEARLVADEQQLHLMPLLRKFLALTWYL